MVSMSQRNPPCVWNSHPKKSIAAPSWSVTDWIFQVMFLKVGLFGVSATRPLYVARFW
jgi:hypothetical protein